MLIDLNCKPNPTAELQFKNHFNRPEHHSVKVQTELTKLYYSIGEVAKLFGVSTSLIRYWESEFTFLRPKKNRKGDRQFTKKDILYLERIYTLVKERGFTLEGAKKELRKPAVERNPHDELIFKLKALKKRILLLNNKL